MVNKWFAFTLIVSIFYIKAHLCTLNKRLLCIIIDFLISQFCLASLKYDLSIVFVECVKTPAWSFNILTCFPRWTIGVIIIDDEHIFCLKVLTTSFLFQWTCLWFAKYWFCVLEVINHTPNFLSSSSIREYLFNRLWNVSIIKSIIALNRVPKTASIYITGIFVWYC